MSSNEEKNHSDKFFTIDEDLGDDYPEVALTWRGLPTETFSDCTLKLTNSEDESDEATYHVHKAVLGASNKRCLYFMKATAMDGDNRDVHIQLEFKGAMSVFPVMLDYIYFGTLDVCTENAEALRHLADFMQCRPMRMAINQFIEDDFSIPTCVHYVKECSAYSDKSLLEVSIRESAKLFAEIDMDQLCLLESKLFAAIVTSQHFVCKDSDKLSKAILYYFKENPETLSSSLLVQLTQAIPAMRQIEAKAFLNLMERVDPETDEESWKALSYLCIRCATALAPLVWRDDPMEAQREFLFNGNWAGDGPSRLFITKLVSSLKHAQDQHTGQQKMIDNLQHDAKQSNRDVKDLQKQLAEQTVSDALNVRSSASTDSYHSSRDRVEEYRDEGDKSTGDSSDRYQEVCRDLAMSLTNKLHEKEQIILNLEDELTSKEAELEKVGQMMVHLNARLKFYEILHNDSKTIERKPQQQQHARGGGHSYSAPNSPSGSRPRSQSNGGGGHRSSASQSSPRRGSPSESSTTTVRSSNSKKQQMLRPIKPAEGSAPSNKPPTSPRYAIKYAMAE